MSAAPDEARTEGRPLQLYAITDRQSLAPAAASHAPAWEASLLLQIKEWVAGGVDWVQLREKDLPPAQLLSLARQAAAITRSPGSRTRLLVNGLGPEQALGCEAHGVHLAGGFSAESVRAVCSAGSLVSVSCHSLAELEAARAGGATLALWAPVFGKSLAGREVVAGTGIEALAAACEHAAPLPVFALGGVSVRTARACRAAGAAGVAGIRLFQQTLQEEDWRALR